MTSWSLLSVRPAEGGPARVAALVDGRIVAVPSVGERDDLADVLHDWPRVERLLRGWDPREAAPLGPVTVLAPLRSPGKLLCAGANYADHLREMGIVEIPDQVEPYFFLLPPTSITGPGAEIVIPADPAARVDWEAELAVVIGVGGRDIPVEVALDHVAGYTIMNDVSARGRHARTHPLAPPFSYDWLSSKGRDTFCPLGPAVTPAWQVPDPQALPVRLWRNGELQQNGSTADMIVGVAALISAVSEVMTLEPGDVLATGTPAGVGAPRGLALADGDHIRAEIGPLGVLENPVRAAAPKPAAHAAGPAVRLHR